MRPPDFWRHKESFLSDLLLPLSLMQRPLKLAKAFGVSTHKAKIPVVCIGNLTLGGAGKTPIALAAGRELIRRGVTVHFLTRGYGGQLKGPLQVDPEFHTARQVGDEALLLAKTAPTWIGADRGETALAAEAVGARVLVMDDGHQNSTLAKDLSIIVVDSDYGFGNGRVFPAGPLREPVEIGLKRADAVIIMDGGDGIDVNPALTAWLRNFHQPIIFAHFEPPTSTANFAGSKAVAFAGISRPQKFFATLEALGYEVIACHTFDDHHPFAPEEIMQIVEQAAVAGARPITTAKDAMRLPTEARAMVDVLEVNVGFTRPEEFDVLLKSIIKKPR